jgi:hypothetical protein
MSKLIECQVSVEPHYHTTAQWDECRVFHGDDARQRANAWVRSSETEDFDGVTYDCVAWRMEVSADHRAVKAQRTWRRVPQ